MRALDPNLAIANMQTLDDVFRATTGRYRTNATVLTIFSALALLLAAVGLYGVLAYTVSQRTRAMGIQMALGAHGGRVASDVVRLGLRLASIGIAIGAVAAWLLARSIDSMVFGVSSRNPVSFGVAPAVLLVVAFVASYLPARRASRIDPIKALRYE